MGLFGGSAMSTSTITSSIDFSPVIQFGENQESTMDKPISQTQTVSPKLDESMTASVGVGVAGGSGSGGAVMRNGDQSQPMATAPLNQNPLRTVTAGFGGNTGLILAGAGVLAVLYFTKNSSLKKKKK